MFTSNNEKISFINDYFQDNKIENNKNLKKLESIPLMIRNNGLFNTLMFISTSKEYKLGYTLFKEFYSSKIRKKGKKDLLLDIYNIYLRKDRVYLEYTKELYDLSCQLKSYVKTVKG